MLARRHHVDIVVAHFPQTQNYDSRTHHSAALLGRATLNEVQLHAAAC